MDDATLLKKLVEYREAHNLTQAELANIIGVTRESLYRWGNWQSKTQNQ